MHNKNIIAFSATLFTSAFLMFALQPMIGKMLLPIVGGAPAGWIVVLAFFQTMLLCGYFIAHFLTRFSPRRQAMLYLLLLSLGLPFMPITIGNFDISTASSPVINVMLLLLTSVTVPFIAISATNSTIQRLFTASNHTAARDPYFLYIASNIGSFAGLLAYPFIFEPLLPLSAQSSNWQLGYITLMILTTICLALTPATNKTEPATKIKHIKLHPQFYNWILLSFIPSALLSAVTTYITTDIFSAPLIWILPLGIYLLTFIVAFAHRKIISLETLELFLPVAMWVTVFTTLVTHASTYMPVGLLLVLHLGIFALIAMLYHSHLAEGRPKDENVDALTQFYLASAVGGCLGGILNAFIVPFITNNWYEYPLLLLAAFLLRRGKNNSITQSLIFKYLFWAAGSAVIAICLIQSVKPMPSAIFYTALLYATAMLALHPRISMTGSIAVIVSVIALNIFSPDIVMMRNFFGVKKVGITSQISENGQKSAIKYLQHGTTIHGMQFTAPELERKPTAYYSKGSPIEKAFNNLQPRNVAIAGLGIGGLNCYSNKNRKLTFFEIDPDIVDIAQEQFTYMSKCGKGRTEIVLGDARLKMAEYMPEKKFDMIVFDTFTSDSIPVHLLTREAFEIYLDKLSANGVLIIHISNRYFDLRDPIVATMNSLKIPNLLLEVSKKELPAYGAASRWLIFSKDKSKMGVMRKLGYKAYKPTEHARIWTDDYADIISTIKLF